MALNPKEASFVQQYLIDKNATQAAIRAGYSKKTANSKGAQLFAKVSIRQEIDKGLQAQADDAVITARRVMQELANLGTADLRTFVDEHGKLKPLHLLTPAQGASLASVELLQRNVTAGDGETDTVYKLKLWDKPRALEMLAKHFGLLIERLDVTIHGGDLEAKIKKARARAVQR